MSIGELYSMYERDELDVHPEFQRFYRWSDQQKSKFVESILLGIPIPSIFVSQRPDGVWDVIDGLQRLSTIFEFIGCLRNDKGAILPALTLSGTKLLPSLQDVTWEGNRALSVQHQLLFKRAKLDIKIILRESDESSKYELFQRLNTGGSELSDQEVRNCILIMEDPDFYRWLRQLADHESFRNCIALTDRAVLEQFDMELVVRFLTLRSLKKSDLSKIGDLGAFLTDQVRAFASSPKFKRAEEARIFESTFDVLEKEVGLDAFRKYDAKRKGFLGGFLISAFEAVAVGLSEGIAKAPGRKRKLKEGVINLWSLKKFRDAIGSGVRASSRIPVTVTMGRELFGK